MARGKNQTQQKDGKHRKETKEEKILRLQSQQEARDACQKLIPFAVGAILILLVIFGIYVRSIPPRAIPVPIEPAPTPMDAGEALPPSVNPFLQDALDQASETVKVEAMNEQTRDTVPPPDAPEIVEL